jgi:HTH-type transcriptional regulator/antitoxin HipB
MKHTVASIGEMVRSTRKSMKLTQSDLALTSGTGLRFIVDLENGKPTCQIGKALQVLNALGISVQLMLPKTN